MEALTRDRDALHLASLTAVAMYEPRRLREEEQRLVHRARALESGAAPGSAAELRAKGEAMVRDMVTRGVLTDVEASA